jgi:hypothetical protein
MHSLVLNGKVWFVAALALALVAWVVRARRLGSGAPMGVKVAYGTNLFYGLILSVMGVGHLTGVTIRTLGGALRVNTDAHKMYLFALGLALVVPAGWLAATAGALARDAKSAVVRAMALNAWLGFVLAASGPSWPLATLAGLNVLALAWARGSHRPGVA